MTSDRSTWVERELGREQNFARGEFYSGIESPINGVLQLTNHLTGAHLPALDIVSAPPADSIVGKAGSIVGSTMDVVLIGVGTGAIAAPAYAAAMTGAALGIVSPTSEKGNFWLNKAVDTAIDTGTFALAGGLRKYMAPQFAPSLMGRVESGAVSGAIVGAASIGARDAADKKTPTLDDLYSIPKYAAFGAALGAATWLYAPKAQANAIDAQESGSVVNNDATLKPLLPDNNAHASAFNPDGTVKTPNFEIPAELKEVEDPFEKIGKRFVRSGYADTFKAANGDVYSTDLNGKSVQKSDGTYDLINTRYGTRTVDYSDGSKYSSDSSGQSFEADGTKWRSNPNNVTTQIDQTGASQSVHANGYEQTKLPDGSIFNSAATDARKFARLADGTRMWQQPDGSTRIKLPGQSSTVGPDFALTNELQKQIAEIPVVDLHNIPDTVRVIGTPGAKVMYFPDGSSISTEQYTLRSLLSDGKGASINQLADGSTTITAKWGEPPVAGPRYGVSKILVDKLTELRGAASATGAHVEANVPAVVAAAAN
jgi:hypothetical protein